MRDLTKEELLSKPDWATHYEHHFGILTPDAITFYGNRRSVYCYNNGRLDVEKTNVDVGCRAVRID